MLCRGMQAKVYLHSVLLYIVRHVPQLDFRADEMGRGGCTCSE